MRVSHVGASRTLRLSYVSQADLRLPCAIGVQTIACHQHGTPNKMTTSTHEKPTHGALASRGRLACLLIAALTLAASPSAAIEIEGFAEPHRTINVGSAETGIVVEMLVAEGNAVEAGQPLARLDSDVYRALLAIAEQNMKTTGRLDSALAEQQLRIQRLTKLEALRRDGHARQEEVDRARAELQVTEGNVTAAREDLLIKKLEYAKVKTQLAHRTIVAPAAGVVTTLHKQEGEFIAPNSPDVLTLVELDPLLATFSLVSADAVALHPGGEVTIEFPATGAKTEGTVSFIAPITDAESGTVQVKVRVPNADGRYRSGERCLLQISQ